jgi:hypothetical protein
MSRLFRGGQPIAIQLADAGTPRAFNWQDQNYDITAITNRWRVDEGWWFHHRWRDYFQVQTSTPMLAVIFRDLLTDQWYLQRIYD